MPDSTAHTTIVDRPTAVTAIAYARRSPHYILFHSSPQIIRHMLHLQSTTDTFHPVTAQSCIFGLFKDFTTTIRTHCNFKHLPDSLQQRRPDVRRITCSVYINVTKYRPVASLNTRQLRFFLATVDPSAI